MAALLVSEMSHQQAIELLPDQVRRLAPQNDAGPPQMGLELIESGFDLPPVVVERGQFGSGSCLVIEDRCDQTINRLGAFDSLKTILDNPHQETIDSVFLVRLRRVNAAEAPIKVSAII